MSRVLVHRLAHTVLVLLAVSVLAFLFSHLSGDPLDMMLPPDATEQHRQEMRAALGLDQPLPVRYAKFLNLVAQGNFGYSFRYRQPALALVLARLPASLLLISSSLLVAVCIAVPVGLVSAYYRDSAIDRAGMAMVLLGQSVPVFWSGILLIFVFAVMFNLLPAGGYGSWRNLILPVVTLAVYTAATTTRLSRSSGLDILTKEFIKTARAKGLSERLVVVKHLLRNALIPVVTVMGVEFGVLVGGAVVTERVFAWPGAASLLVEAIRNLDVPLVQACVFVLAAIVTLVNLLVDLLYSVIDPRIRLLAQ